MRNYIKEMRKRKDLLIYLVKSGLKADNRDSYLGYFWWLLDPLLNVGIYYLLRVVILGGGGPNFPVYLAIGLVVWRWMSTTINGSTRSITRYSSIINQVYLPKSIFPIALSLTQMFNFMFGLIVIAIFLALFGVVPGWQVIYLPIIILVQLLFLLAIALFFGYVAVFIRDIDNLTKHITRILFFTTPIIWGDDGNMRFPQILIDLNPFAVIINSYRDILMYRTSPDFMSLTIVAIMSIVVILLLLRHYSKNEHKIIKAL
ncbi:ABC transporter permease [Amphibacillus sp. MSJ-3]|uniref:ABC transporter permease n=1 Tax=Amphibacillus sp. MSJ-3 TaxID=2841505 RepID=UPI001C0F05C0|nr:ABC transporter permease [Amphibacillus sp. MSJ-3]MBU5594365.1 ABC transporter permease [Amphibacillus sp. MSJ-3]